MTRRVAFVTGASRGIGAESAVALAKAGFDVAIVARTLETGESHDYGGATLPLPGSLRATAAAIEAHGQQALCLRADVLDQASMETAAEQALAHFGRIDLLFNNAIYQGEGTLSYLMDITSEQLQAAYQGNVFTPLALVKALLPGMVEQGSGTILNMLSATAFMNPPAPADKGGWGFAYASSKAAVGRMVGSIRAEHSDCGLRCFNLEPGTVMTEVMRNAGISEELMRRYKAVSPAAIASVVAWLADNEPQEEWQPEEILHGPAIAKSLGLLEAQSLLGAPQ
ncbi:MAG: SDR family oxidoreductase [Pseudomonadales bacterium]